MEELDIINWIQGASPYLDGAMVAASAAATYGAAWLILAFVLTCFPERRETGIAVLAAVAASLVVVDVVLKPAICRPRPFEVADLILTVPAPSTCSFPSGHAACSFAAATAILLYDRRWGLAALAFACLVGVSRVYLCLHWPTDVLAGAAVGALTAIACVWAVRRCYAGDLEAGG